MNPKTHCGYIAIIGKPNVGKSTLLNTLLGQKISIISKKPQTTRHKVLGIKTRGEHQFIFVDTPGLHQHPQHKINQLMIKTALSTLDDVDAIVFMVNAHHWTEDDDAILTRLIQSSVPMIVALNKIDRLKDKDALLPILKTIQEKLQTHHIKPLAIIPISAKQGDGLDRLEALFTELLPTSPFLFPKDQITDRSERFIAAELVREQVMRFFGEEVPHCVTVEIEQFKLTKKILRISALIWVERKGQKKIIIGEKGEALKTVASNARIEMERVFQHKIFLQLWVKVKSGWTDNLQALRSLGYGSS